MPARVLFLALFFATTAWAEKVEYEIFAIDDVGKAALMATGVKEYTDADIQIEERDIRGQIHWSKWLELENGFAVGASIYREPDVTGFGMWAQLSPCGFSWEWFNPIAPDKFNKLQETGQLSIAYRTFGAMKEISEIVFDTDVSLRLNESRDIKRKTHRILIKKGSVLKFPPHNTLHRYRTNDASLACAGR